MRYQILILISKEKITAMDFNINNNLSIEHVSLDGDKIVKYNDEKDIYRFSMYIKEHFNIEKYSDIDMDITIFRLDASNKYVKLLYDEMSCATTCNIIDMKRILPILLLKEGNVEPNTIHYLRIFMVDYMIKVNENYIFDCKISENNINALPISIDNLILYYYFEGKYFVGNIDGLNEFKEKYKELDKLYSEQKEMIEKYKEEVQSIESKCKEEKNRADNLEARLKKVQLQMNEKEFSKRRFVCRFSSERTLANSTVGLRFSIKYTVGDGEMIKRGTRIAKVVISMPTDAIDMPGQNNIKSLLGLEEEIYSVSEGRIYHLYKNGDTIHNGEIVSVIGDFDDNKEDILKWVKKNR